MDKARLILHIDFKGSNPQQAWAMAEHIEKMVATLLGDEQEKGNVEVTNYDTAKETIKD